jgi:ankyrin repeat protein
LDSEDSFLFDVGRNMDRINEIMGCFDLSKTLQNITIDISRYGYVMDAAIEHSLFEIINVLIKIGFDVCYIFDEIKHNNKTDIAKFLYSLDYLHIDKNGYTFLMRAVDGNYNKIVKTLFKNKYADFDLNIENINKNGKTALMLAQDNKNSKIIRMFENINK